MAKKASKQKVKSTGKSKASAMAKSVAKSKTAGKAPRGRSAAKATGIKTNARVLKTRIAESGKTSRIKGHVSAQTRKSQAKRDGKAEGLGKQEFGNSSPRLAAPMNSGINVEVSTKGGCSAEFIADVTAAISQGLGRYRNRVTRIEAHFEDINGPKGGADHRCRLEARLAAMKPQSVSEIGSDSFQALKGAMSKMDRLLKSMLGKRKDVKGTTSASGQPT